MKSAYALVMSYSDGSGALRAFGPYPTESAAKNDEPDLQALYTPDNSGKWEIIPLHTTTPTDLHP